MPVIILGEFNNDLENSEYISQHEAVSKLSTKERNNLDSDEFGLPSKRKYPLNDKKHVQAAIRMFNHADKSDEEELADNILSAMEKYKISINTIGDSNRLKKYIKEEAVTEGLLFNMPKDAKKLRDQLQKNIKEIKESDEKKDKNIVGSIKNSVSLSDQDAQESELKMALTAVKKTSCNILDVNTDPVIYGNAIVAHSYHIYAYYKKYIVCITINGSKGIINSTPYVELVYDSSKCEVPKNVVTNMISLMKSNINKISATHKQFKIKSNTRTIDRAYGVLYNKYKNKYSVRKTTNAIIISTLKLHESCASVPAAIPSPYVKDAVYIVNYTKKNTFNDDTAICRGNMSDLYIYDDEPKRVSLKEFENIADNITVYEFYDICDYKSIIENSYSSEDFYKNMVHDENAEVKDIEYDPRFKKVPSFLDELSAISECILESCKPYTIEESMTILPMVDYNEDYANVKYYKNINGIFAMNENTGIRSGYYNSVEEISESVINLLSSL